VDDQILRAVVEATREVTVEDRLDTIGVALLGIERSSGHVRDHGVASAEGVLCGSEDVILRSRLREPNVTTVAAEVAGLEGLGNVLLDDDGATSGVDEPGA
jgi:hypothetical protein